MKLSKLLPLMLLAFTLAFVSCNKGPGKLIAKTWKITDVMPKGVVSDSAFQATKAALLKVEMTFKDNQYTMVSNGAAIETGSYTVDKDVVVLTTENGMKMDAVVTKDRLTLNTPDFTATLLPK